ncbi:MAG: orotidine-5'-phosphate decarboxylase, partial [Chloroflexota bacterium]|nr:orotidine-5'-phosphate decarboxylase [Chloroflexota bacterium]
MSFTDKLRLAQTCNNSWLCVGLDLDAEQIPASLRNRADAVVTFNRAIIEATRELVCAYKPNLAFYLARGSAGVDDLIQTIAAIPRDLPVILDAKFGDIESSARGYARFAFETLGADAVTVNPYLGADAIAPFLEYSDRAVFLLAHTSNPGASTLQDMRVATDAPEAMPEKLFVHVARFAKTLKGNGAVGLVVGATFPDQLRDAREANPSAVFLVPGIGTQGGSLAEAVQFGSNDAGIGPIINASRSILYASSDEDYAGAARAATITLRDEIRKARPGRSTFAPFQVNTQVAEKATDETGNFRSRAIRNHPPLSGA